ncbi:MAG: stringent starvation protein B [Parasphingorhabdus sp.]|jgi:stringent starvation protein B
MDCGFTPQIMVKASVAGVNVPAAFVQNGTIILNVHDHAVRDLNMENEVISFSARFSGVAHNVIAPMEAVVAIYARENGQGLFFDMPKEGEIGNESFESSTDGQDDPGNPDGSGGGNVKPIRIKPNLKLV